MFIGVSFSGLLIYFAAYFVTGCRSIEPTVEGQIYSRKWRHTFLARQLASNRFSGESPWIPSTNWIRRQFAHAMHHVHAP
jgi:hypothetical protein